MTSFTIGKCGEVLLFFKKHHSNGFCGGYQCSWSIETEIIDQELCDAISYCSFIRVMTKKLIGRSVNSFLFLFRAESHRSIPRERHPDAFHPFPRSGSAISRIRERLK